MKLSIITVCLNSRQFLERTIRSVASQTWRDFEYVVVDGASTDGTADLIQQWVQSIDKYVSEKDSGIYNAQNKGVNRSAGEYLLFLNAGDVFVNEKSLEDFFSLPFSDDLVYGDIFLEKQGQIVGSRIYPDAIPAQYWQTDFLCHQAVLHKRTLFDKHGLYNEANRYASDHELFFKVWLDKTSSIRHVNKPLVIYNLDGITGNSAARRKIIAEYDILLQKYFNLRFKNHETLMRHYIQKTKNLVKSLLGIKPRIQKTDIHSKSLNISGRERKTILFFNTSDTYGGAARATQRIIRCLPANLYNVFFAVKYRYSENSQAILLPRKPLLAMIYEILKLFRLRYVILRSFRTENPIIHSPAYVTKLDKASTIRRLKPDIIHLNWIGQNLFTVEELGKIEQPIVWTFHDMWAFCGAEHVSYDDRFKTGYSAANRPETESGFDLNQWVWRRKQKHFAKIRSLHIVCPSEWMSGLVRQSILFRGADVTTIPNGLNTDLFVPGVKAHARQLLGVPMDKTIVLFGAMDITRDRNKGYDLLLQAVQNLVNRRTELNIHLMAFGNGEGLPENIHGIPVFGAGLINDDAKIVLLYQAADVTVVPSLIESFGQTASESLACGTPVACFDTSGLKSIVDHKKNGYLAKCYDPSDLASGIEWVCEDNQRHLELGRNARSKAESKFSLKSLGENYSALYERVLSKTVSPL